MNVLQDRSRIITADELIRRYDLNNLKKDRNNIKESKEALENQNNLIKNFADSVTKELTNLQDQVDGNITTWFFSGVPTLENYPSNEWLNDKEKNNHLGDLYYDQDTGYAYRFTKSEGTFEWLKITDIDITKALAIANKAQDTADKKRQVFVISPSPPYEVGDLWIKEDKDLWRCRAKRTEGEFNEVDWIPATDYSNDDYAKGVEAVLNSFKEIVETDYATRVQLETTKDGIMSSVENKTTEVETKVTTLIDESSDNLQEQINQAVTNVTSVTNRVSTLETATEITTEFKNEVETNGVKKVNTGTVVADIEGVHVDNSESNAKSNLGANGLEIENKNNNNTQFFSGVVTQDLIDKIAELEKYLNQTISYSDNIYVKNFFETPGGRWEPVNRSGEGKGIGFFPNEEVE